MLLFNWVGYRLFTSYLESKANTQLEAQLDNNNYDETQLVAIKVPVSHLAYYNTSTSFERVDGQMEIKGVTYKYVKRRLYNDSVELLCIPNDVVMQLNTAKDDFFKIVNDLQYNRQGKKADSHKIFSKSFSFDSYTINHVSVLSSLNFTISETVFHYSEMLPACYSFIDEQPPDFFA